MARSAGLMRNISWGVSFRFRDFRILWPATLFYYVATAMEQLSVGWLVLDMTGSVFMVGVAYAVRSCPNFFLGIVSGVVADRLERRTLLRFTIGCASITAGSMALLLLTDSMQVWTVMVLAAVTGTFLVFYQTAAPAYAYDIVGPENALNGVSLIAMTYQAGGLAGVLLGGAAIAAAGPGSAYLAVSALYLASLVVLLGTRRSERELQFRRESVLENLAGYARIVRQNHVLFVLMCLVSVNEVFGFTHTTLLPVFAKDVLSVGPQGLGFMYAVRQGGGLLGLAMLAGLKDYQRRGMLMFGLAGGGGMSLMAFSLSSNWFFFLGVLALVNFCFQAVDALFKTLMQNNVPDDQRGRAMGSWSFSIGLAPVGHLGIGGLASLLGAAGALLVNGAVLTFTSVATATALPKIRRLR